MTTPTLWTRARTLAEAAPPTRNRVVDFLRALSILAVVVGHWLVAAPSIQDGVVVGGHLLGILPWTQWLTWGFQVMPIFFLVGGFSNGMSWAAHRRKQGSYADWFGARIQRLVAPVLPLFLIWTLVAFFGTTIGIDRAVVSMAVQLALVPVWFLAVYLLVTALVPFTHAAWHHFGLGSIAALIAAVIIVDILSVGLAIPLINWLNFGFVWLAVHQLGYAWQAGRLTRPGLLALGGLTALLVLVLAGPYPVAMIGVPGEPLSNSMPPTLALLALGVTQTGIALALEPALRRMLSNIRVWTAVVLMNGMIMTIYLWHLTAFVLVLVAAWLLDGVGLGVMPGTSAWWLGRPLWFALYIVTLLPLIMVFVRFETGATRGGATSGQNWRLIIGLLLICAGLGLTAGISIASPLGVTGVRLWVVALPFIGAALVGFGPVAALFRGRSAAPRGS
jgi:peptidoglycan/LPS O-acetylase OafA/YrhL